MNFQKYEQDVKSFLTENYTNLKRAKVKNSEFALKELLLTEQADINNYASSIVKKIVSDARKSFVHETDVEKGYDLAKEYKFSLKIPAFKEIEVSYSESDPYNMNTQLAVDSEKAPEKQAFKNYEKKSPIMNSSAVPKAIGAGVATVAVGLPSTMFFTSASFATSLIIVSLSAVVIAGVVYTLVCYMDENGNEQQEYVQPKQTFDTTVSKNVIKKTISQESMDQLLDLRKAEAEQVLIKTIQDAKMKYEEMQLQLI